MGFLPSCRGTSPEYGAGQVCQVRSAESGACWGLGVTCLHNWLCTPPPLPALCVHGRNTHHVLGAHLHAPCVLLCDVAISGSLLCIWRSGQGAAPGIVLMVACGQEWV